GYRESNERADAAVPAETASRATQIGSPKLWWDRRLQGGRQAAREPLPRRSEPIGPASGWRRGAVAQMGERCNRTAEVRGSIPLSSTSLTRRPSGGGRAWGSEQGEDRAAEPPNPA